MDFSSIIGKLPQDIRSLVEGKPENTWCSILNQAQEKTGKNGEYLAILFQEAVNVVDNNLFKKSRTLFDILHAKYNSGQLSEKAKTCYKTAKTVFQSQVRARAQVKENRGAPSKPDTTDAPKPPVAIDEMVHSLSKQMDSISLGSERKETNTDKVQRIKKDTLKYTTAGHPVTRMMWRPGAIMIGHPVTLWHPLRYPLTIWRPSKYTVMWHWERGVEDLERPDRYVNMERIDHYRHVPTHQDYWPASLQQLVCAYHSKQLLEKKLKAKLPLDNYDTRTLAVLRQGARISKLELKNLTLTKDVFQAINHYCTALQELDLSGSVLEDREPFFLQEQIQRFLPDLPEDREPFFLEAPIRKLLPNRPNVILKGLLTRTEFLKIKMPEPQYSKTVVAMKKADDLMVETNNKIELTTKGSLHVKTLRHYLFSTRKKIARYEKILHALSYKPEIGDLLLQKTTEIDEDQFQRTCKSGAIKTIDALALIQKVSQKVWNKFTRAQTRT